MDLSGAYYKRKLWISTKGRLILFGYRKGDIIIGYPIRCISTDNKWYLFKKWDKWLYKSFRLYNKKVTLNFNKFTKSDNFIFSDNDSLYLHNMNDKVVRKICLKTKFEVNIEKDIFFKSISNVKRFKLILQNESI